MNNLIEIDGKPYDMNAMPPSAIEAIQTAQLAQQKASQANIEARLANIAVGAAVQALRAAIAPLPTYSPEPEAEPQVNPAVRRKPASRKK